jgi:hypothetical protein
VAYAADDTTFNESFATAVERIGGRAGWPARGRRRAEHERRARAGDRTSAPDAALHARRLQALYQRRADDEAKRERKAALMAQMRAEYEPEARALGRLCRLRRLVRTRQQCQLRRAGRLQRTGAGLRAPVRAQGATSALLCRGAAPGRLPKASGARAGTLASVPHRRRDRTVPDIRIHREHQLGLAKARKIAWNGPSRSRRSSTWNAR